METAAKKRKTQLIKRRKEQILAAAKTVFARYGYRRTKTEQIAAKLNVGKGTLYRYFQDKRALFLAVFEDGMQRLRQSMRANVEPIANPPDKVKAAVRTYLEFFDKDRELIEIAMQVRSEFKDEYRRIFLTLYGDYIVRIQENLRRGMELGLFEQVDIEKTADAISDLLQGTLQSFYVRRSKERLTSRAEAVASLMLHGVLKAGKSSLEAKEGPVEE